MELPPSEDYIASYGNSRNGNGHGEGEAEGIVADVQTSGSASPLLPQQASSSSNNATTTTGATGSARASAAGKISKNQKTTAPVFKLLRSSRRKLVPNESRKRALFSCDRCKKRKSGCKRIQSNQLKYDDTTPCIQCSKAGVECITTIPRKKRVHGVIENVGFHYKCLLSLVNGLFPDKDVNKIEELIELGKDLKIPMPSMEDESDMNEVQEFSKRLTTTSSSESPVSSSIINNNISIKQEIEEREEQEFGEDDDTEMVRADQKKNYTIDDHDLKEAASALEGLRSGKGTPSAYPGGAGASTPGEFEESNPAPTGVKMEDSKSAIQQAKRRNKYNYAKERLLVDRGGNTHYIGSQGTSALLNGLSDIITKNFARNKAATTNNSNTTNNHHHNANHQTQSTSAKAIKKDDAHAINSENEPIYQYPSHLFNTDLININKFPLVNLLNREEANHYTDVFFDKIHPYYFCFDEEKFRRKYDLFWKEVNTIQYNYHSDNNSASSSPMSVSVSSSTASFPVSCRLSNSEICCIYIVWLLGRRFDPNARLPSNRRLELDNELSIKFIDIIKLSLADILLTPTLNGIRLLFYLAIYLDSLKTKESAWILLELAGKQAISLGIHRKSIVSKFKPDKQDEMKRLLWSIFKAELSFCAQLGRSSTFNIEEIDISLPSVSEVNDQLYKKYYFHGVTLSKIMYQILENRKPLYLNNEPLSLYNIERAMKVKTSLSKWWDQCDEELKDYKSLPHKRYKMKLHIQFHHYYITLTLPYLLYIINNSKNYHIKKDDPLFSMLCLGIQSAIETAEILTFGDSKGFFNGSVYMDTFYGYNAIMILILTYILISGNSKTSYKQFFDEKFLIEGFNIDLNRILHSINLIRVLNLKNSAVIDGSMKRASEIVEILLNDLGIVGVLEEKFGLPSANQPQHSQKEQQQQQQQQQYFPQQQQQQLHQPNHNAFNIDIGNIGNTLHSITPAIHHQHHHQQPQPQQHLMNTPPTTQSSPGISTIPQNHHFSGGNGNTLDASSNPGVVVGATEPVNYSYNNDVLFDTELIDILFGNENLFNDYNQMNNGINN